MMKVIFNATSYEIDNNYLRNDSTLSMHSFVHVNKELCGENCYFYLICIYNIIITNSKQMNDKS